MTGTNRRLVCYALATGHYRAPAVVVVVDVIVVGAYKLYDKCIGQMCSRAFCSFRVCARPRCAATPTTATISEKRQTPNGRRENARLNVSRRRKRRDMRRHGDGPICRSRTGGE